MQLPVRNSDRPAPTKKRKRDCNDPWYVERIKKAEDDLVKGKKEKMDRELWMDNEIKRLYDQGLKVYKIKNILGIRYSRVANVIKGF